MGYSKNILLIFFLIITIIFSALIWDRLDLPFNNEHQIVGFYSANNVSHLNDIVGYILFILIPTIFFLFWLYFVEKKRINLFFNNIKFKDETSTIYNVEITYLFLVIGFLFFEFLSLDFQDHKVDYFHEGQRLSAAFNNKVYNSFFASSYITVGLFFEIIGPKLIWKIFNNESIGLIRFLDLSFLFFTKTILVILSYQIAKYSSFNYLIKNLFFVMLCFFCTKLLSYSEPKNLLDYRDIPILLTLVFFFSFINNWKRSYIYLILIGILFSFSYLWSVDRALVQNLFTFIIIFYLLINKKYKEIITLIFSISFSFLFIFFILGNEFSLFVNNTISTFVEHSLINGIIHPIPFGGGSLKIDFLNINSIELNNTRATKTILAILFSIIISIYIFCFSNKINYNTKIFLFSLSIVSFFSYIYALGRTDYSHLREVFAYPLFFYLVLIFYLIINFFKFEKFKFLNSNYKLYKYSFYLLIIIFFSNHLNFSNIFSFKERLSKYSNLNDQHFIDDVDKKFINFSKEKFNSEKCVSLFSNDVALLYLIKKPSCTKYYFVYSVGSISNQKKMIKELSDSNYILIGGKIDKTIEIHKWAISLNKKYPLIKEYLNKNFELYETIGDRKILKRKK